MSERILSIDLSRDGKFVILELEGYFLKIPIEDWEKIVQEAKFFFNTDDVPKGIH